MDKVLTTPIDESVIRTLHVGDTIYVTGCMFTARDDAHHLLLHAESQGEKLPLEPGKMAMFHCGPVVEKVADGWRVVSAGPTTSARMEMFEADFLERFGTRLIIGKGGMGTRTLDALQRVGAVYTHFTGGAGALAARAVRRVPAVYWLEELGIPEAVWVFDVEHFGPLTVTMDAHGKSLYDELELTVNKNLEAIHARIEEEE
ncbi:fumarate hydratase C-terminal domain-containing protein [Candidatus Bipolaricaulota bacterium]|jgi:fumarate hydratase subunit beta|nr:fumarate hydratase C-terminal domain-containing protein [Candidatus Bipolaricaulota bacterium]